MTNLLLMSKGRPDTAAKTVKNLLRRDPEGIQIIVVVERQDLSEYSARLDDLVEFLVLPKSDQGIGYARDVAAREMGDEVFYMSDDEVRATTSILPMAEFVREDGGVLGCGAWHSNYGLLMESKKDRTEPFPVSGSIGYAIYALNGRLLREVGGFDPRLRFMFEDTELARLSLARLGRPWYIHPRVKIYLSKKRHSPGGLDSFGKEARLEGCREGQQITHEKWPDYIPPPPKRWRFAWKRFIRDHAPEYLNDIYGEN